MAPVVSSVVVLPSLRSDVGPVPLDPAVVVGQALDVVLAEVRAPLYLDEHERLAAGVLDAVRGPDGDVDRAPARDVLRDPVERDHARPHHDVPVLGALVVTLVAEALARVDRDAFDLERGGFVDHLELAPRPL